MRGIPVWRIINNDLVHVHVLYTCTYMKLHTLYVYTCFVQEAQWVEKEMEEKNQAMQEKVNNAFTHIPVFDMNLV